MIIKEIVQKWRHPFSCTLIESIMSSEVKDAFDEWINNTDTGDFVVIGGMAVGYYTRPRMTQDVDVLYQNSETIPSSVNGFKKHRGHAFEHKKTGIEIETLDPDYIKQPYDLVQKVFDTSVTIDGVRLPSATGLVALKIKRHNFQDIADIDSIASIHRIDLTGWPIDVDDLRFVESRLGYPLRTE